MWQVVGHGYFSSTEFVNQRHLVAFKQSTKKEEESDIFARQQSSKEQSSHTQAGANVDTVALMVRMWIPEEPKFFCACLHTPVFTERSAC